MKPTKTIADYIAGRDAAKATAPRIIAAFDSLIDDCNRRIALPIGDDARVHVTALSELAATEKAMKDFLEWPLEHRQQADAEAYLRTAAPEICGTLRAIIAERSKAQPDFIASKLKQAAEITQRLFSKTDRQATYQEREAAEQAAADAEFVIAVAVSAVRSFELMPNQDTFGAACARVNEIQFPLVSSSF